MDITNFVEQGKQSFAAGQYEQARSLFKQALETDPDHLESLKFIGDSFLIQNDIASTRETLNRLISACKNQIARNEEAMIYVYMGDAHTKLQNNDEAMICFKKASEVDPGLAEAYYKRANLLFYQGDSDAEAEKYYKLALEKEPQHATSLFNLGNIYMKRREDSDAIDCFKKAIVINKADHLSMLKLGIIYVDHGSFDEAISYLKQAISYSPSIQSYNFLAKAYAATGDQNQSINCIIQVARMGDPKAQQFLQGNGISW